MAKGIEPFHQRMEKLCVDHESALRALTNDCDRTVDEALIDCLANMARIESHADQETDAACNALHAAKEEQDQTVDGAAQWVCQKQLNEAVTKARDAAHSEREAYVAKHREAHNKYTELTAKARADYLKAAQKLFKELDVDNLDAATIAQTAQALWSGFASR